MSMILLLLSIFLGYIISWILYQRQLKYAEAVYEKIIWDAKKANEKKVSSSSLRIRYAIKDMNRLKNIIIKKHQQNIQSLKEQITYLGLEIKNLENRIKNKEKDLQDKLEKQSDLKKELKQRKNILSTLYKQQKEFFVTVIDIGSIPVEEKVLASWEQKLLQEKEKLLIKYVNYISLYAENIARRIVSVVVQRCSFSHWFDSYPNTVIFDDRNYIENLLEQPLRELFLNNLGTTLDLQENSNIILINESDGYSREIVRRILESLISERILDTERITALYFEVCRVIDAETIKNVENICSLLKVEPLPDELVNHMARLKYRTSFGQNILDHSKETAILSSIIAAELGFDTYASKLSGFLHDIGKSIDYKESGGHSALGKDLLTKENMNAKIIEGVVEHHEDVSIQKPYAGIVNIADAISASRPGARRETIEKYLKKLEKLEAIAKNVEGIYDAYAVSAGKEIRVIVDPDKISDEKTREIAKQIASTIEKEILYSGIVKIIVVREKTFEVYT